jgi:hypothetical protein
MRGRLIVLLFAGVLLAAGCDYATTGSDEGRGGAVNGTAVNGGAASCHPSYEGECLDPSVSDYDCEGGSGNGPGYTGRVSVVGPDEYGLDRDGDGVGCD